jgi:hypothetical protein
MYTDEFIKMYEARSPLTIDDIWTYQVGEGGWLARADYLVQSTPHASAEGAKLALAFEIKALNAAVEARRQGRPR